MTTQNANAPMTEFAPPAALPDIEVVSADVHADWINGKIRAGVTTRLSTWGEELMVPYDQLSEEAKELDRSTVRTVYAAIARLQQPALDRVPVGAATADAHGDILAI